MKIRRPHLVEIRSFGDCARHSRSEVMPGVTSAIERLALHRSLGGR